MPRMQTEKNSCHVVLKFKTKVDAMNFYCNSAGGGMQYGCDVFKTVEGDRQDADLLACDAEDAKNAVSVDIEFYETDVYDDDDDDDDSIGYWMDANDVKD